MTPEQILAGIAEIVDEVAGVPADKVVPSASFTDDLELDSLTMVEVVTAAEQKFDIRIPDADIETLATVADVISYVEAATAAISSA